MALAPLLTVFCSGKLSVLCQWIWNYSLLTIFFSFSVSGFLLRSLIHMELSFAAWWIWIYDSSTSDCPVWQSVEFPCIINAVSKHFLLGSFLISWVFCFSLHFIFILFYVYFSSFYPTNTLHTHMDKHIHTLIALYIYIYMMAFHLVVCLLVFFWKHGFSAEQS